MLTVHALCTIKCRICHQSTYSGTPSFTINQYTFPVKLKLTEFYVNLTKCTSE